MAGDVEKIGAAATDDVIWQYVGGNEGPQQGRDAYKKAVGEFIGMTSERKLEADAVWGAEDWVFAQVTTTATMSKDMGPMKVKGKSGTQTEFHFFQMKDGKIARHYLFANDMPMMVQLGVLDPAAMMPKGDKAAEPAKK